MPFILYLYDLIYRGVGKQLAGYSNFEEPMITFHFFLETYSAVGGLCHSPRRNFYMWFTRRITGHMESHVTVPVWYGSM